MIKTAALLFGACIALQAQDLPPEQAKQLDAAKKKMDEMIATSVGAGTFQFVGGQLLNGNPVKGQPYSAEAVNETTQVLADGNRIVNRSSSMLYRDSEGRERREESFGKLGAWSADGQPAKAIFISDPVAKTSYSLDEKSHTASKSPAMMTTMVRAGSGTGIGVGTGAVSIARNERFETASGAGPQIFRYETRASLSSGSPAKVEKLGTQVIEGIAAEGTRETVTIAAGQIGNDREIKMVSERWYSPELQVTVMSTHSDPRTGETLYKLTNVSRAEPSRALFEVPADYSINDNVHVRKVVTKEENQF
jgi:hypothetical protein